MAVDILLSYVDYSLDKYGGPSIIRTPLVTADSSGVWVIEIVWINETT